MNKLQENMRRFKTKNLHEQTQNKINLPDGNYLGTGSGNKYTITDMQGNDTGYEVVGKSGGIRGFKENDPVTITNGIPTSKTWGVGGTYTKDPKVNYNPSAIDEGIVFYEILSAPVFEKFLLSQEKSGHKLSHDGKKIMVKLAGGGAVVLKTTPGPGENDKDVLRRLADPNRDDPGTPVDIDPSDGKLKAAGSF